MITAKKLKEMYKPGTPIFIEDVESDFDYTKDTIRKSMSLLFKAGDIRRFSRGVYYIPEKTIFGDSKLNPDKVIVVKYLGQGKRASGVYAGITLLNKLRLTTQVPNVIEVVTNNETNRKREITVGKQRLILRKARVEINSENARLIEVLEAIKTLKTIQNDQIGKITSYIKENNIRRNELDKILVSYPKNVYKKLVESGIIDEFAS
jgi:predicted transcriptional regulator of viral defense system